MNTATLELLTRELAAALTGRRFGKVFQLSRLELAVDLRLNNSQYLYLNTSPGDPRLYLITRRLKDLERSSGNPSPFALSLRKRLSGAEVTAVRRLPGERVIEFDLSGEDETGAANKYRFEAQLTGRSANLFLLDETGILIDRLRDTAGEGQQIGERYNPPRRDGIAEERAGPADRAAAELAEEPSSALDSFYLELAAERRFQEIARSAAAKIAGEVKRREKLLGKLRSDLAGHGDAEQWKRYGDLLLASASTARREGGNVVVTDYFDESAPEISIEADENRPLTESAENYYRKYTKARNAATEIAGRIESTNSELAALKLRLAEIEDAVSRRDEEFLSQITETGKPGPATPRKKDKQTDTDAAARSFISSDGFEILVGKKAKDNDFLTFRIAKSLDTWMHAADYPGSHVVVRNPGRAEIPQRTLLEAAQLAAFYSQGKTQTKAAVHYTQKKFVNKPKGAPPGLVSLASFKTLLVVPEFPSTVEKK